jgi:hypothetical protein
MKLDEILKKHSQLIDEIKTHPACTFGANLLKPLILDIESIQSTNGKGEERQFADLLQWYQHDATVSTDLTIRQVLDLWEKHLTP